MDIAILDTNISGHIRRILAIGKVRIKVFVDRSEDFEKITKESKDSNPIIPLILVLYGDRHLSTAVGNFLSKARIYLQHPIAVDSNVEYKNPHFYHTNKIETSTALPNITNILPTNLQSSLEPQSVVEQVLQTLGREESLQQTNPDLRVVTQLLWLVTYEYQMNEADRQVVTKRRL